MMSESRRNRRKSEKNKRQVKSDISRKDKIIAFIAIVIIFILAVVAAYYYSLSKSGLTLF
jgi:cell division protein FtsL|tara:strand:+ start:1132 stop:1311 length:180 start_codon:yes stop_codon:yes gene_type:complete